MIPSAYQCEFDGCDAAQHEGTAFCKLHLAVMRIRRIAELEREAARKDAEFMAARREAEALDHEEAA